MDHSFLRGGGGRGLGNFKKIIPAQQKKCKGSHEKKLSKCFLLSRSSYFEVKKKFHNLLPTKKKFTPQKIAPPPPPKIVPLPRPIKVMVLP